MVRVTNIVIAMLCHTCGKYLKEVEFHFYGNECTECNHRRYEERAKKQLKKV